MWKSVAPAVRTAALMEATVPASTLEQRMLSYASTVQ